MNMFFITLDINNLDINNNTYNTIYYIYLYLYIYYISNIYLYKNNTTITLRSNSMFSIALYFKKWDGFLDKNTQCSSYIRDVCVFIHWLQQCLSRKFNVMEAHYAKTV